jgi:pyruvate dehydrogenase E1 component alpha subunit
MSVANRAGGYGMPGVVVDGQSALEMYEVGGEAIRRARAGDGPTLIEAQTYRYMGHFGADNPLAYRDKEEEDYYKSKDCIAALRAHLVETNTATEAEIQTIEQQAVDDVAEASTFANESPYPEPEELTADVYISYP